MFVGALNQKALAWLAQQRECFSGRQVVVGCSGSFSTELMLLQKGVETASIHGNDVALFSYVLGEYLCGRRAEVTPRAEAPVWPHETWKAGNGTSAENLAEPVAAMHVLLEMLPSLQQRGTYK